MATIMVVDDSKTVRSYHGSILKSMGMDVLEAENGMEALEKSLDTNIDLYLVDVNMPIMDGLTVIRNLRVLPEYKTTPILMLTTEAGEAMKSHGKAAGATGWLVKPFNPNKLLEVVKSVLAR